MAKEAKVERPTKKSEYEIRFASAQAKKGWTDLAATIRNSLVDSWDFLTRTPELETPFNYKLKGELGMVTRNGSSHNRLAVQADTQRHSPALVLRGRTSRLSGAGPYQPSKCD